MTQLELTLDFGKPSTVRNRYTEAIELVDRNLGQLVSMNHDDQSATAKLAPSHQFVAAWVWSPLFDLKTELVSTDLTVTATMAAEFDHQNGLLLAWGMYDWTEQVVVDIAREGAGRCRLVVLADNYESLKEARSSLREAGISRSDVAFDHCAHVTSWFRDGGPIVGTAPSGGTVWFDAALTRQDLPSRQVTDALPSLVSRDWQTRVARSPLHIEGGMLLSNGIGLSFYSRPLLEINRRYGFSDDFILRELKRITGAKKLVMLDAMIDEPTGHLDMFMTLVDRQTVVVGEFLDPNEPNAQVLDGIADLLGNTMFEDEPLRVVRLPMPPRREGRFAGRNTGVFRSFTNVVYLNGVLLVPSYEGLSEDYEQSARDTYAGLLPHWKIEFIDCSRPSLFSGALHCLVSNLGETPFIGETQDELIKASDP